MSCLFFFLLTSALAWNRYACNEDGYNEYLKDYADLGKTEPTDKNEFDKRYNSSF